MTAAENEILIEAKGLKHAYQDAHIRTQVLHGIDMTIYAGSNIFLTGYSGSGKTTLISLIGCLRSVQEGSLKLLGKELNGASETQLRQMRCRIGYVFQHFNLLDFMTIRQNVQQSLELQNDFSPREAKRRSEEMLDQVGLGDRVNAYPRELSGGQKQRVAVARALVHRPKLVLADEPTAALDSATGREIIDLFQRLSVQFNSAMLIVTHNMRVLDSADDILHMEEGRLGTAVNAQLALVFPTLNDHQLATIVAQTKRRTYQPNEVLIQQGDEANEFFLLLKGEVEILRETADGQQELITRLCRRGDYFGEMGLLSKDAKRTATVRAADKRAVEVLIIEKQVFANMIGDSKQTRAVIKDEMLQRMTGGSGRICD